ncbi:hypothetical protein FQN60_009841 [Etheostoma spectabile]|uniref:Uncharacterized protein n=1 Tax=Etheostoma spectabile TaxID=54343 RepID=A0A5J5D7A0_9PERO|nr:hypothetical protein FQN60_009841 [Etheostoma spectabile]
MAGPHKYCTGPALWGAYPRPSDGSPSTQQEKHNYSLLSKCSESERAHASKHVGNVHLTASLMNNGCLEQTGGRKL